LSKSVQAVERACDVIFAIASNPAGVGVTEIASHLGLSKSAVHRILIALGNKSMVEQDPATERYLLHPKVLELTAPFYSQQDIVSLARPFLVQFRDRFKETAVLVLRVGFSFMSVTHVPSPHEYRFTPTIGKRFPLHRGAFGKAILANLSQAEITALFQDAEAASPAAGSALEDELRSIKEAGFATSRGEVIQGQIGVAAAILEHNAAPVGCIGIGGPRVRLQQFDLDEIGRELAGAAKQLSSALACGRLTPK
jgi:DNA-binding IclR family transcriptional regulator